MILCTGYDVRRDILWITSAYTRQYVAPTIILIGNLVTLSQYNELNLWLKHFKNHFNKLNWIYAIAVECCVGNDKTFIGFSVTVGSPNASTHVKVWCLLAAIVRLLGADGCGNKRRMFVT